MSEPYRRGARMEYAAVNELKAQGYEAQRTAGSHSPFDIVAWDGLAVRFIQVKLVSLAREIAPAVAEAREAWADKWPPVCLEIRVEVWIRQDGKFHIFRLD